MIPMSVPAAAMVVRTEVNLCRRERRPEVVQALRFCDDEVVDALLRIS